MSEVSDVDEVSDLSSEDLVKLLRDPTRLWGGASHSDQQCALMGKLNKLPPNAREAVDIVIGDRSVKNPEITLFLRKFGVNVHVSEVQRHRHLKRGCLVCGTGAPE